MIRFAKGELEKIRELLRLSWRENREVGAKLCGSKDEVVLGATCMGDYCSLELKDCRGKPVIGSIHTHPHSAPYLSEEDVIHAVLDGESIMCVCGNAKAPGIAVEFEKPVPFRNMVCRCWEVDKDKEAYESIRRIFKEAEPEIRREMEELEAENRELEARGEKWRYVVKDYLTLAYIEAKRKAREYIKRILRSGYYEFKVFK